MPRAPSAVGERHAPSRHPAAAGPVTHDDEARAVAAGRRARPASPATSSAASTSPSRSKPRLGLVLVDLEGLRTAARAAPGTRGRRRRGAPPRGPRCAARGRRRDSGRSRSSTSWLSRRLRSTPSRCSRRFSPALPLISSTWATTPARSPYCASHFAAVFGPDARARRAGCRRTRRRARRGRCSARAARGTSRSTAAGSIRARPRRRPARGRAASPCRRPAGRRRGRRCR